MKRIQLEPWTTYEKLCLASAVQTTGDQNWTAVSRAVKNIFDESTRALGTGWRRGRPPDWFNMRQCAAHYEHLLNSIVAPRRKKRTEKATNDPQVDSPAEIILSVLRQDYKEELRVELVEQQMAYLKLKKEIEDIQAGLLDDSLENMLAEAEAKEREKDIKIKLKFKLGEKNLEGDHSSTTIKSEPDVTAPHTESEVKSTSPLLTSLLQSPSPLTRHPPLMAPPPSTTTISHLLNSSPSVPSGETSTLTKLLESPTAAAVAASLMSSAHLMPAFTAPPPVSTVTPPTIVASSSSVVQPTTVMQSSVVASPAVGTPTATVASSTIVVSPPSEPRSVTAVTVPKLASPTPEELASVEKTQLNISSTVTVPSPSTLETVVEVKQEEEEPVSMDVDPPCTGTHSPVQLEAQIEEVQIKVDESEIVEEEEVVGEPIKDPTLEHAIEEIVHSEVETEIVIEPEEQIDDKKKGVVRRLDLGLCDDTTEEEVVETVERIIEKVEEAVILDDIEAEEEVLETVEQIIEKVEEAIIDTMEVGGSDDMANDVQTVTGEASSDVSGSEARSLNQTLESEATEDALDSLELDQEAVELIVVGPNQPSKVISVHHETSSETQNDSSKSDELSEVKDLDSTEIMNEESNLSEDGDQKEEIILDNQSTVAKIEVKDNMGDQLKEIIKSEDIKSEDITDSTVKLEELDTDVVEEHEVHSEEVVLAEEVIAEESSEQVLIAEGNTDNEEAILDKVVEQSEEEHKMDVDNVSETLLETVEHTSSEEQVASSESVKVDTITVTAESTEDIKTAAGRTTDLRGKKVDIIESKEIVLTEAKTVDVKVRSSREDEKCETPSKQNTEKKQSDIELKSSTSSDVAIQPDKSSPTPVKPPKHQPSPAQNAQVQAVKESKKVSVGTPDKCDSPLATIQSEKETPPVESERKRGGRKRAVILLSDSKPNSPASSILTEEDRDYKSWKKSILLVYNRLAAHKYASVFLKPITEAEAAGYHSIIKRPMDLTTIKRNIETGVIRTTVEFQRDMLLMVQNAIMYNKTNTLVYKMANDMLADMITQMEVMVQAIGDGVPLGRDTYERLPTRGRAAAKAAVTAGTDTPKRKRNSGPDDRPTTKRNKYDSSSAM